MARLLLVLAATWLAAGPALACCVLGHAQPPATIDTAPESAPPCHGAPAASVANPTPAESTQIPCADCPGCLASGVQADPTPTPVALASAADLESPSAPALLAPLSLAVSVAHGVGPPTTTPRRHVTPITLHQRLLL